MVIVQRIDNGMFWRNASFYHRRRSRWDKAHIGHLWTDTVSECLPFKNESGARSAFLSRTYPPYNTIGTGCCHYPFCKKHQQERTEITRANFDKDYKVVSVDIHKNITMQEHWKELVGTP
jgi:hypothetical protein